MTSSVQLTSANRNPHRGCGNSGAKPPFNVLLGCTEAPPGEANMASTVRGLVLAVVMLAVAFVVIDFVATGLEQYGVGASQAAKL